MTIIKREQQAIAPGHEPAPLKSALEDFLRALDSAFPGKRIIWREWDHARFDGAANRLCAALGYSAGAPFLTAYGYTIVTEDDILCPEGSGKLAPAADREVQPPPAAANGALSAESAVHTGKIVSVLPNGNSGFVRDDKTGSDYYFNIRSFAQWAGTLAAGRAVSFRLACRCDHKHDRMRENAVELRYIE